MWTGSQSIQLSGDAASPGNQFYYGTDTGGIKGYFALTSGPSTDWTTVVTKASDQDVVNSTTLTDDTELQLSVTAGSTWFIELLVAYSNNGVNEYKWALTVSAGTMHGGAYNYFGLATSGGAQNATQPLNGIATSATTTQGTRLSQAPCLFKTEIVVAFTDAATFKFQFAENSAAAGTQARTEAGSVLRGKRLI